MFIDDPGEDIGEVSERVVEFANLDHRRDDCPVFGSAIGTGEERIFSAIERNRTDQAFDRVTVDLDAAVVKEAGEALPAREGVADRLGELGSRKGGGGNQAW